MTYAQLTIIAEAAAKAVRYTGDNVDDVAAEVKSATIEAGKKFISPLQPIEVD